VHSSGVVCNRTAQHAVVQSTGRHFEAAAGNLDKNLIAGGFGASHRKLYTMRPLFELMLSSHVSILSRVHVSSGEAMPYAQRYIAKHVFLQICFAPPAKRFYLHRDTDQHMLVQYLFRASGEAISCTQRYLPNHFLIQVILLSRPGDFRYTTYLSSAGCI